MPSRFLESTSAEFGLEKGGFTVSVASNCGTLGAGPPDSGERTVVTISRAGHSFWGLEVPMSLGTAFRLKDETAQFFQPRSLTINVLKREDTRLLVEAFRFAADQLDYLCHTNNIHSPRPEAPVVSKETLETWFPWFDDSSSGWRAYSDPESANETTCLEAIPKLPQKPLIEPDREPIPEGRWKGAQLLDIGQLQNLTALLLEHGALAPSDQKKLAFTTCVLLRAFNSTVVGLIDQHGNDSAMHIADNIVHQSIRKVLNGDYRLE